MLSSLPRKSPRLVNPLTFVLPLVELRIVHNILTVNENKSNFIGKRHVGKPRKRWINAVEIDRKEILKVRNWKRESQHRQVWRRHLKEAKARLRAVAP
jgi:hypothetical protein